MPETTPLIKAALNLRVGAGFDVYDLSSVSAGSRPFFCDIIHGQIQDIEECVVRGERWFLTLSLCGANG